MPSRRCSVSVSVSVSVRAGFIPRLLPVTAALLLGLNIGCAGRIGDNASPLDGSEFRRDASSTAPPGFDVPPPPSDGAPVPGCPIGNEAVQSAILVPRCGSCHGAIAPQGGLDLVSPNLAARLVGVPARGCTGQTLAVAGNPVGSYVYRKVVDPTPACGTRMPPTGSLGLLEVTCLQAWIADGLRASPPDAGTVTPIGDAAVWMPTPGRTPSCSDRPAGPEMCPGRDCMTCHRSGGSAPDTDKRWTIAGTIFGNATDPVTAGISGAQVRVRDAMGQMFQLTTNSVGNFYTTRAVSYPLQVEVQRGTSVAVMPIPAPAGGCNSCHTLPSVNQTAGRVYVAAP